MVGLYQAPKPGYVDKIIGAIDALAIIAINCRRFGMRNEETEGKECSSTG